MRLRVPVIWIAIFFTYWVTLFGSELAPTALLCYYSFYGLFLNELQLSPSQVNASQPDSNLRRSTNEANRLYLQAYEPTSNKNATTIPLILHRTWRDHNIPEHWSQSYKKCEETYKHRNWTSILWTDATIRSFLTEHYNNFLPTYESYPYDIQRVDAARYFILYHYGGVYLDLDVSCREKKDMTDLLHVMESMKMQSMFPLTSPIGVSNDVMFASKENTFLEYIMQRLPKKNRWFGLPYLTVLFSTGPMFLSLAINYYPNAKSDIIALSSELYSETDARFFRHLPGSTWHSTDAFVVKWLIRNRLVASMVVFVAYVAVKNRRTSRSDNPMKRRESKPHRLSV